HDGIGSGHVVLGKAPVTQGRHRVSRRDSHNPLPHLFHYPVHLVPRRARIERIRHPFHPLPRPQVRSTHAAPLDPQHDLARARAHPLLLTHLEPPRPDQRCRVHGPPLPFEDRTEPPFGYAPTPTIAPACSTITSSCSARWSHVC